MFKRPRWRLKRRVKKMMKNLKGSRSKQKPTDKGRKRWRKSTSRPRLKSSTFSTIRWLLRDPRDNSLSTTSGSWMQTTNQKRSLNSSRRGKSSRKRELRSQFGPWPNRLQNKPKIRKWMNFWISFSKPTWMIFHRTQRSRTCWRTYRRRSRTWKRRRTGSRNRLRGFKKQNKVGKMVLQNRINTLSFLGVDQKGNPSPAKSPKVDVIWCRKDGRTQGQNEITKGMG